VSVSHKICLKTLKFLLMYSLESHLNSAERLMEYGNNLEQEAVHEITATKPPLTWPSEGCIEFKDVTMRYSRELPAALKCVNLNVAKAEKVIFVFGCLVNQGTDSDPMQIGICGRTGAGKSTIMTAFYRIVELSVGQIMVDKGDRHVDNEVRYMTD
jgi:ATP-binding cassette, subfamily C (CFTR/MRP), member 1